MKAFTTFMGIILTLAIIVGLGYGLISGLGFMWQLYAGLESVTRIILLSVMFVMMIGFFVVASAIKAAALKQSHMQLIQPKLDLYEALINLYRPLNDMPADASSRGTYKDIIDAISGFETNMKLVASTPVIKTNRQLLNALQEQVSQQQIALLMDKLVVAIRKDLGVANHLDESKLPSFKIPNKNAESEEKQVSV